jgi:hypothetical protein
MRTLCIAAVAAGLTFAPVAWAQTLPAGQPAGVLKAQRQGGSAIYVIGVAVVAAAIAVAVSGSSPASTATPPVTTTPTTSTN